MSTVDRNNKRSAEDRKNAVIVNKKKMKGEKSERKETKLRLRSTPLSYADVSIQCGARTVGGKSNAHNLYRHNRLNSSLKLGENAVECIGSSLESTPVGKHQYQVSPFLPGARCGEIFVANNARQWTFICTFCNKSTRDIGAFICHIKMKHLEVSHFPAESYYDHGDIDNEDDCSPNDQDYLDCGNYLDVSVHTGSDETSYNGQEAYAKKSTAGRQLKVTQTPTELEYKKNAEESLQRQSIQQNEHHALNFENNIDGHEDDEYVEKIAIKQEAKAITSNGDISADQSMNGDDGAQDFNDHDHFLYTANGFNAQNGVADEHGHNDDDYDNQLLLAPDDSIDTSSVKDIRSKRRQIRGTAYCALCNKTFQYYSLYRNHMIKHSNETPFKCPICKKGFKSKQAIRYHMNTHQKEKQFKCSLCHAGFYTENQFITHVLTHADDTTFPCMVCGEIYRSDKEREAHLSTHTGERPFRCEFCNKLFRLKHHLSNHLKMHRQYRCNFCKVAFTSVVHQRKPYACPQCEFNPKGNHSLVAASVDSGSTDRKNIFGSADTDGAAADESLVNPLQIFEAVALLSQRPTECVDLAEMVSDSDDQGLGDGNETDESNNAYAARRRDGSVYVPPSSNSKKRYSCKYCARTYSHSGGLNYHIRLKHSN